MSRGTGTGAQLDGLHRVLTEWWATRLERAKNDPIEQGLTAAEVTALQKFLKDNDISAPAGSQRTKPLQSVLDSMDGDYDAPPAVDGYSRH